MSMQGLNLTLCLAVGAVLALIDSLGSISDDGTTVDRTGSPINMQQAYQLFGCMWTGSYMQKESCMC